MYIVISHWVSKIEKNSWLEAVQISQWQGILDVSILKGSNYMSLWQSK